MSQTKSHLRRILQPEPQVMPSLHPTLKPEGYKIIIQISGMTLLNFLSLPFYQPKNLCVQTNTRLKLVHMAKLLSHDPLLCPSFSASKN